MPTALFKLNAKEGSHWWLVGRVGGNKKNIYCEREWQIKTMKK
jgi:hypothetical protein